MAKDSRQKVEQYLESKGCGNESPATTVSASKESMRCVEPTGDKRPAVTTEHDLTTGYVDTLGYIKTSERILVKRKLLPR